MPLKSESSVDLFSYDQENNRLLETWKIQKTPVEVFFFAVYFIASMCDTT